MIIWDLRHLPNCRPRRFIVTFLSTIKIKSATITQVSINADKKHITFKANSHLNDAIINHGSLTQTLFECWSDGRQEGSLSDWMSLLESMEHTKLKIEVDCEQNFPWSMHYE